MDPDHDLNAVHSPRQKVELKQELNQLSENLHFEAEENPFSYYDEDNHRDVASSDQENVPASTATPQKQQESPKKEIKEKMSPKKQEGSPFHRIEIGDNLAEKPAIELMQSPKGTANGKKIENVINSPPSIKLVKEAEFNLGAIGNKQSPKTRPQPATDRVYKSQLETDMQDLKRKFLGKDIKKKVSGSDKKDQKGFINKTVANMHKKHNRESNFEFEEMRMLIKMGFEKKKTNYEMLRQWDRKRAESLALHGKIIELLQNEVDIRIKASLQNFQNYQTFFRQKAKQQQKYSTSPVINTRYALQNNSLSKNVYINCSVILNSLCDENTTRCKKISQFISLIRNNILKELTENHLSSSQRELLKVREKISTLKSALKKHNQETEVRANELGSLFTQQASNISNQTEKDFYRTQLSFLRKAIQQIHVQRKLGEYCLEYYHTAVQQELKRSQVIRQAMLTYSKGLKNTYYLEPSPQCPQIEQMSKQEEIKLIQEFFSLDQMFDQRTLELFKQRNHLGQDDDITIESFTKFIKNFDYHAFDSRILLLKQFYVKNITGKGKQLTQQPCFLAITVDHFLHLFLDTTKATSNKPDITIKIGSKWIEIKSSKDDTLELVKKEQRRHSMMSYFWDSKADKVYKLRFAKKDSKEEFIDYIGKLMVDQF